jgi:hypothetical protein
MVEPILELSCAAEWAAWLDSNHGRSPGVLLRIPKKGAQPALTYAEALDAALAWGWIDSQQRALDDSAWLQRCAHAPPESGRPRRRPRAQR